MEKCYIWPVKNGLFKTVFTKILIAKNKNSF